MTASTILVILISMSTYCTSAEDINNATKVQPLATNQVKAVHGNSDESEETITQLKADVEALQAKLSVQSDLMRSVLEQLEDMPNQLTTHISQGTTYVRWGRWDCPESATRVYYGYAGKAFYVDRGGTNYQCLPKYPQHHYGRTARFQSGSYMYGVEYGDSPVLRDNLENANALCAVCSVETHTKQLMIPARYTCPLTWTREYYGWLVAQKHDQGASTFECLDHSVMIGKEGGEHQNGGIFRVVESTCDSLPCPPYVPGFELSCVVCTK